MGNIHNYRKTRLGPTGALAKLQKAKLTAGAAHRAAEAEEAATQPESQRAAAPAPEPAPAPETPKAPAP